MKKTLALLLLAAPLAGLQAAKINPAHIPAKAKWLLHMDIDAFKETTLGKHVMKEANEKGLQKMKALQDMFGIDLENDIHGATAFGNGKKDNGVLIIHAKANQKKLMNFVVLNDTYEKTSHGKHDIHSLEDEKKPGRHNFFCFYNKKTIVAGPTMDHVTESLDVLNGEAPSMTLNDDVLALGKFVDSPVLHGYGDFAGLLEMNKNPKAELLKTISSMGMAIGEEGGLFMSAFGLSASTEESAAQVENLVRGMVALGSLSATEKPELAKLANAVKISRDGKFVAIQFEMESQEMIGLMETSSKRKNKWRKMKKLD